MIPTCAFSPTELVVDRVIDVVAVVETADRTPFDLPMLILPYEVREGDRLAVCLVTVPSSPAREARSRVKDERSSTHSQSRSIRVL